MKQETIDDFRAKVGEHEGLSEGEGFRSGVFMRLQEWRDILSVLEAATRYAKVIAARSHLTPRELWEYSPDDLVQSHDALLALIDLETK